MRWHGVRLEIVAAALVIALGSFWGMQWLYSSLNFQKPLKQKLAQHQFVAHYEVKEQDANYNIIVTPAATANLMQSYQLLYRDVQQVMGNKNFTIQLSNQSHDLLDHVANEGQFAIYEAISVGNYTEMQDKLNQMARQVDVNSQVFIDHQNVYWQLGKDQHFVYLVVARQNNGDINSVTIANGR